MHVRVRGTNKTIDAAFLRRHQPVRRRNNGRPDLQHRSEARQLSAARGGKSDQSAQAASAEVGTGRVAGHKSNTKGGRCWLRTLLCQPPERQTSSSSVMSTPTCHHGMLLQILDMATMPDLHRRDSTRTTRCQKACSSCYEPSQFRRVRLVVWPLVEPTY